jgi:hypothetical protein
MIAVQNMPKHINESERQMPGLATNLREAEVALSVKVIGDGWTHIYTRKLAG